MFRKAMTPYKENFVIIGGTACDIQLTGTAMRPRVTDDIDIIVVVERLTQEFVNAFWQFIHDGNYQVGKRINEGGTTVYALYRFTLQDEDLDYPPKIELLSRHSDLLGEPSVLIQSLLQWCRRSTMPSNPSLLITNKTQRHWRMHWVWTRMP